MIENRTRIARIGRAAIAVSLGTMAALVSSVGPTSAALDAAQPTVIDTVNEGANRPGIAFNPERNEYLVAYTVNPTNIAMVRLDAAGKPLGAPVRFGDREVDPFKGPAVAYQPATDEHLIAWTDFGGPPFSTEVLGLRVSATGSPVGSVQRLSAPVTAPRCENNGVELEANLATGGYTLVHTRFNPNIDGVDCEGASVPNRVARTYVVPIGGDMSVGVPVLVSGGQDASNIGPDLEVNTASGQILVGVFDRDTERYVSHLFDSSLSRAATVEFDIPEQPGIRDQYARTRAAPDPATGNWTVIATSVPVTRTTCRR